MKAQSLTKKFMLLLVCSAMLLTMSLLTGCKGKTGSAGATGADGATGPVTTTSESCDTCHGAGRTADIMAATTHGVESTASDLIVSNIVLKNIGGKPVVSFHVDLKVLGSNLAPVPYSKVTATSLVVSSIKIADLILSGTTSTATGKVYSTDYFEPWASEAPGATAVSAGTNSITGNAYLALPATGSIDITDKNNGNYTYTFTTAFGSAWPGMSNQDYSATNTKRIMIQIGADTTSTFTGLNVPTSTGLNRTVAIADFAGTPLSGATATAMDIQRRFVTIEACKKCHGPQMEGAAHASSYLDTNACVMCHTPFYSSQDKAPTYYSDGSLKSKSAGHTVGFMDTDNAILPVFIHQIHASTYTAVPGLVGQPVTFPQDISNCVVCHTNSGLTTLGTGDKIDNWKSNPTRRVCGSCHTTVDFAAGTNHTTGGPQADDSGCKTCHTAAKIVNYHDTSATSANHPNAMNVPEYDVTLSLSAPAGAYYVAGETVTVTATLKNHSDGSAVAGTVYTADKDAAGTTGGGLSTASLYVYGPRSKALPLLGTQANPLFTSATNTNITTDATGFKYVMTIPAGVTAGTYAVRFRAGDYGRISDTDYKIESVAFTGLQIGTATEDVKIDGDTACVNCHGNGTAPFHDARHAVVFDTDQCVSCHDQSGGHADPLANRVHAVHSASVKGDLADVDWSDVTFPQDVNSCTACHNSGNPAYKTNLYAVPCYGCHADSTGAADHMIQNGGKNLP